MDESMQRLWVSLLAGLVGMDPFLYGLVNARPSEVVPGQHLHADNSRMAGMQGFHDLPLQLGGNHHLATPNQASFMHQQFMLASSEWLEQHVGVA